MAQKKTEIIQADVESHIFTVRGQKVIIDTDLAQLYGVETKQLNQAIKRNSDCAFNFEVQQLHVSESRFSSCDEQEATAL